MPKRFLVAALFVSSLFVGSLWVSPPLLALESSAQIQSPIPFKGIATLHTLKTKTKNYELETIYPTFRRRTRLTNFINATIKKEQRKYFDDFLKDSRQAFKEYPQATLPYEYSSGPSLTYYAPSKLVSLCFDSYQFMGGAHGMGITRPQNFGYVNGRPKQLSLGDFFKPGTDYRTLVETKLFAKLKKDERATWVHDGSVKRLENSQFNNFSVDKNGFEWTFNSYEMGPYANGPVDVRLSVAELGPGLKKELLRP